MTYGDHILQLRFKHTAIAQSAFCPAVPPKHSQIHVPKLSTRSFNGNETSPLPKGFNERGHHGPVEVLRGANRNDSIGVCESGEYADPVYGINPRFCGGMMEGEECTRWSSQIGRGQPWW